METQSDDRETAKDERMETDSPPNDMKDSKHIRHRNIHQHTYTAHSHNKIPSN
jgi:hypothetical protein